MKTAKTKELYIQINRSILFALIIVISSCNNDSKNKVVQVSVDSLQVKPATDIDKALIDVNLLDTIKNLMTTSLSKDTFEYEAFYNENSPYLLLYYKTGNLFNKQTKHSIALYSINDTTIMCELHYLTDGKWTNAGNNISMHIDAFSPAYFNVFFDDYNFDGNRDLNIIFYNSMSVADTYGYILTFNEPNNLLTLHPETIEIPSLVIDKKDKMITSTEYSNPNRTTEKYKIVSSFHWTNDTLKLFSEKKYKHK